MPISFSAARSFRALPRFAPVGSFARDERSSRCRAGSRRRQSGTALGLVAALVLAFAASAPAEPISRAVSGEPRQLVLVLDASGSMWGRIDDEPKIRVAHGVVEALLEEWTPALELGLTAYGHRRERDCDDIETLIAPSPPSLRTSREILSAIEALNPRGKSPIAAALQHAARVLSFEERAATVVLVSDGRETCDANPCEMAKDLERAGVDFTAHVVGFGVSDEDAEQLRCLAEVTGGRFFGAGDSRALRSALETVVREVAQAAPAAPRRALDVTPSGPGKLSLRATLGASSGLLDAPVDWKIERDGELVSQQRAPNVLLDLADGEYRVDADYGDTSVSQRVDVRSGVTRTHTLDFGAGVLRVFGVLPPPGGSINDIIEWQVFGVDGGSRNAGQRVAGADAAVHAFVLPAGSYRLTGRYGIWSGSARVELRPGETSSVGLTLLK